MTVVRQNEDNNRKIEDTIVGFQKESNDTSADWMNDNPVMESVSGEDLQYFTE